MQEGTKERHFQRPCVAADLGLEPFFLGGDCLKNLHFVDVNLQLIRGNGQIKGLVFLTLTNLKVFQVPVVKSAVHFRPWTWLVPLPRAGRYSPCRRWDARRAAVVSVQGRRSSRRSLLSCKANRYLGVQNSTNVNSKGPGVYPHICITGEHRAPGNSSNQGHQSRLWAKAKWQEALRRWRLSGRGHAQRTAHTEALRRSPSKHTTPLRGSSQVLITSVTHTKLCSTILLWKRKNIQLRYDFKCGSKSCRQIEDIWSWLESEKQALLNGKNVTREDNLNIFSIFIYSFIPSTNNCWASITVQVLILEVEVQCKTNCLLIGIYTREWVYNLNVPTLELSSFTFMKLSWRYIFQSLQRYVGKAVYLQRYSKETLEII